MGYFKTFIKGMGFLAAERLLPAPSGWAQPLKAAVIRRILIAECGGIGDVLRIFPAIAHLHDAFPSASISLLVAPAARDTLLLFKKPESITEVIDFDVHRRHRDLSRKLKFIASLRKKQFDLIYMPTRGEGMRELSLMSYLIQAPYRLGFAKGRAGRLNTNHVEFSDHAPILEQNMSILAAAGLGNGKMGIDIVIPEEDASYAGETFARYDLEGQYPLVCIHPSASWNADARCWPLEYYVRLAKDISDVLLAKIILLGSSSEQSVGKCIEESLQSPDIVNLVGTTTIGQMAALIGRTHLFIGNDSGPLHLAAASGVPYIGIFGPTSARQVLATSPGRGVTLSKKLPCSPCYTHQPEYRRACKAGGSPPCLEGVSVQDVLASASVLLTGAV